MKTIMITTLMGLVCLNAQASNCKRLKHEEGKIHVIEAQLSNYTHIILPENIKENTKGIIGNSDLWDESTAGPHIYIKPTSVVSEGQRTSYSVVGESGESYDFRLERRSHMHDPCYKITHNTLFSEEERQALRRSSSNAANTSGVWQAKYLEQQQTFKAEKQAAVLNALRRYRYQIYTRYDWKNHGNGFIGSDFISDVYDDGRFTYIRVNKQNRGIMMIEAMLDGQTELIEAKYDTVNNMYTVSGIFPEFTMKYGKSKVEIHRDNNETVGEY